jgi:hypothetical protein
VEVDRRCEGGRWGETLRYPLTLILSPEGRGYRLGTVDATTMAGVGRTRGSASLSWQALQMLNPSNEANFSGGLDLWKDRNANWLGCTELRKSNWLRLSEIGFVWGSGAIREAVWGEKDVRWTREKEILQNEPNFIQAGVEKWGGRSQKRSQFAAYDGGVCDRGNCRSRLRFATAPSDSALGAEGRGSPGGSPSKAVARKRDPPSGNGKMLALTWGRGWCTRKGVGMVGTF